MSNVNQNSNHNHNHNNNELKLERNYDDDDSSTSSSPTTTNEEDSIRLLHNHENVICISDRVDQHLIFPFIPDPPFLQDVLQTILQGTSVLIVGEPGIGKRTMSLGLARALSDMRSPQSKSNLNLNLTTDNVPSITSRSVYTLSLGREFWSHSKGVSMSAIHNQIRQVFLLVQKAGPGKLVLCIDDLDVLSFVDKLMLKERPVGDNTEPCLSIENMLRFLLFSKKILCLCTCITAAYDRLIQLDTTYDEKFSRSFKLFRMQQPSLTESQKIVDAHRERIEAELDVVIRKEAVTAAIACSVTFLTHRNMPEKALDLLQEACVVAIDLAEAATADIKPSLHEGGRVAVYREHISKLIQQWCGVTDQELERCYNDERFSNEKYILPPICNEMGEMAVE